MYNPAQAASFTRQPAVAGLIWSEYLYLIAVAVAAFLVVNPLGLQAFAKTELKHLPLVLTLPVFILSLSGRRLADPNAKPVLSPALVEAWPLALLSLFIVAGSMYLRVFGGVRETMLNVGLYIIFVFVGAAMVLASKAPEKLLRAYLRILIAAGLIMFVFLLTNYRVAFVYHEEIFLVVPLAVYCALALKKPSLRIGGMLLFLAAAVLSTKNTGYLIGLLVLLYLGYGFWLPRLLQANPLKRFSGYYLIFVILLVLAACVMFLLAFRETYLPSGNTHFRLWFYQLAWERFLGSPVWGQAFADSPVVEFTLFKSVNEIIPTHSDVLDLLANGGVIAVGLWLYGIFMVARAGNRTLLTPTTYEHPWTPYAHTFAVLSLAAIIVYSFNPILMQPAMSYLLWTNLGMLLGLSLRPEAARAPVVEHKRPLGRYEFKRL